MIEIEILVLSEKSNTTKTYTIPTAENADWTGIEVDGTFFYLQEKAKFLERITSGERNFEVGYCVGEYGYIHGMIKGEIENEI